MGTSGIVRRIDELGRIVIPKEMRRVLRLKEGDEVEILSDGECITVRRYSAFSAIAGCGDEIVKTVHLRLGCDVMILDSLGVKYAAGTHRKCLAGKRPTDEFMDLIFAKSEVYSKNIDIKNTFCADIEGTHYLYACAVSCNGERFGSLAVFAQDEPSDEMKSTVRYTAQLLGAVLDNG